MSHPFPFRRIEKWTRLVACVVLFLLGLFIVILKYRVLSTVENID